MDAVCVNLFLCSKYFKVFEETLAAWSVNKYYVRKK